MNANPPAPAHGPMPAQPLLEASVGIELLGKLALREAKPIFVVAVSTIH